MVVDPNIATSDIETVKQELSVEEVAQMDAYMIEDCSLTEETESVDALSKKPIPIPIEPIPIPIEPFPFPKKKRNISGCYESCPNYWKLELRIDVDGYRPMKHISGDYYTISGKTVSYFGSFIIDAPQISVSTSNITITGIANTTWNTSYKKIRIVIPRHTIFQPAAHAHVQWMTTTNKKGSSYICTYKSHFFRTVHLEQDFETDVTPFSYYDTGSLPSGGSKRTLSVAKAYAEAGVQILESGVSNEIRTSESGSNQEWSNAELHAAMVKHFKHWKNSVQWKVWLFHAMRHEFGSGLRGIMFDSKDKQRQGCASFYQIISGSTATKLRDQLYVCVHELGHCFNLYHSFHKKYMNPPVPNRPDAKSWMNYPQNYPGGSSAFWADFPFQFDSLELIHLRHAYYNNIIMGGNDFGAGAALKIDDNIIDDSGLKLKLESKNSVALGEPVTTEIKLYVTDTNGKEVHKDLHPNFGFVQIAIEQPSGNVIMYHPPIEHMIEIETVILDETTPSIYESAYIGYDKECGLLFDQAGIYKLRAIYYALDASVVLSEPISLHVQTPVNTIEEEVANLFLGDEQGMLLYLLGSDSESLINGNEAFDKVINEYSDSPLVVYAQLVKGFNASREFKNISNNQQIDVREPQYDKASQLLSAVIDTSDKANSIDNITLNMTLQRKIRLQISSGKKKEAKETLKKMVDIFEKKQLKPHVTSHIMKQIDVLKKEF